MKTRSIVTSKETEKEESEMTLAERIRADKTDLEKLHDDLREVSWELDKAMSPLRAIRALEDEILNGEGKDAFQSRLDAMNLADFALNAVVTINKGFSDLLDRLEKIDMQISREK